MKVAQLMATIPDLLPPEYAAELQKLQSEAPPMGWPFVKRRMMAELGPGWESKFARFEHRPAAAASLGQVHRARSLDGAALACKLQYPDMQSAVEADLQQLQWLLAIRRRLDPAIDTTEIGKESARGYVRSSITGAKPSTLRSIVKCSTASTVCACRAPGRNCRPDACSRSIGSKARACWRTRTIRLPCATRWQRRCSPLGGFHSAALA